jgi:hypothetical protein
VNPQRCPVAPENPVFRQLLYGRNPNIYRVLFKVLPKRVVVAHIRHRAQGPFLHADLN